MHFRLPKPLHGWREFAGEVGIIVLGVLIALGAEQVAESIQERGVTAQTRRDVRQEAAVDLAFVHGRLQEAPCVARRLDVLDSYVLHGPAGGSPLPAWIGRPSNLPIFVERWKAVTSSARSTLFSPTEQSILDNMFAVFEQFQDDENREQVAWTQIKLLERLRPPFDEQTRFKLLGALEEARHEDYEIRVHGYYAVHAGRRLDIAPNMNYGAGSGPQEICLPMSMSPDKAQRELRDDHLPGIVD